MNKFSGQQWFSATQNSDTGQYMSDEPIMEAEPAAEEGSEVEKVDKLYLKWFSDGGIYPLTHDVGRAKGNPNLTGYAYAFGQTPEAMSAMPQNFAF